ncbi:Inhibitory regulator protein [Yarrowia sp. C11]|nr:Inhibitory regulator protein [Yarrowia sp. E02]KAG5373030.1 Inhibitory regulator protein [Yarrowia sp. C11]
MMSACRYGPFSENLFGFLQLLDGVICNDRATPVEARSAPQLRSLVVILRLLTDFIDAHWEAVEYGVSETKQVGVAPTTEPFTTTDDDETNASLYAESADQSGGCTPSDKERYFSTRPPKINPNLVKRTLGLIITIKPKIQNIDELIDAKNVRNPSLLTEIEYNCNRAIRFLCATNWDEVYALTRSKLALLKLPGEDDNAAYELTELASLLFLDRDTLLPVLKDFWSLIPHIRRPKCQQLALGFLRKSIKHWMVTHARDLARIDEIDHLASVEAQGFFNYIYTLSNQQNQGNMRPSTYKFLTTLILLVPSSFQAYINKKGLDSGTTEMAFLRHLKNSLNSTGKAFSIAVTCVSEIVSCAQLIWQYNRDSPVIAFAQKVYPDLYTVLFSSGHKISFVHDFDEVQSGFVASYLHLNQAAISRDVLPMITAKNAHKRYLQNVVHGISKSCSGVHGSPLDTPAFQGAYEQLVQMVTQKSIRHAVLETSSTPTPDQERERHTLASILRDSFTFFDQSFESHDPRLQQSYLFQQGSNIILPIVNAMLSEDLTLSRDASAFASKLLDPRNLESSQSEDVVKMYRSIGMMIRVLCEKIVNPNVRVESLTLIKRRILFSKLEGYLDARCYMAEQYEYLKSENSEGITIESPESRLATSRAAEVVILMALASPDMKLNVVALRCLCIVVKETSLTENVNFFLANPDSTSFTIAKNFTVYSDLCQQIYALTGPAALQKRLRKYLQRIDYPSESITSVWKEIEKRWSRFNSIFDHLSDAEITRDNLINQWRNYSGFLASLSGCFVRSTSSQFADNPAVQIIREHVYEFLQTMVGFMVSPSALIRETACEVLAIDASPLAYHHVFSELDHLINDHVTRKSDNLLLPEQVAAFVKSVLSRVNAEEFYINVDLGALTLRIAKHLESYSDSDSHVIKLKLRVSMLAQTIAKLQEGLNIRHNAVYRTSMVTILSQWFRSVALETVDESVQVKTPTTHLHRQKIDLAVASITAMALSLDSLELETSEESVEADGGVSSKIAAFAMHFNMLLKTIDKFSPDRVVYMSPGVAFSKDKVTVIREKTILALSNLISSNADVGLKFALPLGLHKDTRLRLAFLEVFTKMVGGKIQVPEVLSDEQQYEKLVAFVMNNMDITYLICEGCPGTETDNLSELLLDLAGPRSLELVQQVISREIQAAPSAPEVLRRNCVATRMLSKYAKRVGEGYLRETLKGVLRGDEARDLGGMTRDIGGMSISDGSRVGVSISDSSRVSDAGSRVPGGSGGSGSGGVGGGFRVGGSGGSRESSFGQAISSLVSSFPKTLSLVPPQLNSICHTIWTVFESRFNSSPTSAVGAFIFLRFFCPAIVSPESEGLVTSKLTGEARKECLQLAKLLQNMANGTCARVQMDGISREFLDAQTAVVSGFLRDISSSPGVIQARDETPDPVVSADLYTSQLGLHKFLYNHWEDIYHRIALDKRYKKLLRSHLQTDHVTDDDSVAQKSKNLTILLSTMKKPKAFYSVSAVSDDETPIRQFIHKNMHRDVSIAAQKSQVVHMAVRKDGIPVIVVNCRMHDPNTMDTEYLLYRFYQVALKLWEQKFAVVVDATCYVDKNYFDHTVFRSIARMAPAKMLSNCIALYFLNCSVGFGDRFRHTKEVFRAVEFLNPDKIPWRFLDPRNIEDMFDITSLSLLPYTVAQLKSEGYEYRVKQVMPSDMEGAESQLLVTIPGQPPYRNVDFKVGDEFIRIMASDLVYPFPDAPLRTVDSILIASVTEVTETDDGFSVVYSGGEKLQFLSPRKSEIARTINEVRAREHVASEPDTDCNKLIVRPEDVIPALLNIGLRSLVSDDNSIRTTAFRLLCLLQSSFALDFGQNLMPCEGLGVPHLALQLAALLSEEISISRPEMTYDFLSDFFTAFESVSDSKRQEVIAYASPWVRNIYEYVFMSENNGYEKTARLIGQFCDITYRNPSNYHCFLHQVWKVLCSEDELAGVLVSEIVSRVTFWQGQGHSADKSKIENMVSLLVTFPSVSLCGRIVVATRAIAEVALSASHKKLSKHPNWDELGILLRVCREIFFNAPVLATEYLADVCFIVSIFVDSGSLQFRQSLYHLMVNTAHSFGASPKLQALLVQINEPKTRLLFGLHADNYSASSSTDMDNSIVANVDYLESCCAILLELLDTVGDKDQANMWRTRWITFVARAAFNDSPAVQGRALVLLGCLAKTEVEDDMVRRVVELLVKQMTIEDPELARDMAVCAISCLTKMVTGLDPRSSIYVDRLFWIAIACVRSSETTEVFNAAMGLLDAVVKILDKYGDFLNGSLADLLIPVIENDSSWAEFDALCGIRMTREFFETAVCATILRGMQKSVTRPRTLAVLETLLEVSAKTYTKTPRSDFDFQDDEYMSTTPPHLCYLFFLHLCSRSRSKLRSYYWLAGYSDTEPSMTSYKCPDALWSYIRSPHPSTVFVLALGAQLFKTCEDDEVMEMRYLGVLSTAATDAPSKFIQVYSDVRPKLASHCSATLNVALLTVVTEVVCKVFSIPDISEQVARGREKLDVALREVELDRVTACAEFNPKDKDYRTFRHTAARSVKALQPHKYY